MIKIYKNKRPNKAAVGLMKYIVILKVSGNPEVLP